MKYVELQVITSTEASDAVSEILYEEGASGVLIEDPNDFRALNGDEKKWDYVDDEFLRQLGEDTKVKGYFYFEGFDEPKRKKVEDRVLELDEFGLDKGKGIVTTREVDDRDWADSWKKYYKPLKVGDSVVIKPTWEEYTAGAGEVIVEIDPGMAFGTGTHETTIMCIRLLEKYVKLGYRVFDAGCGSGILGITAARLNAGRVLCIDTDEVSCRVAEENTKVNRVEDRVQVKCGNLLEPVSGKADIIVANIIADIIISLSRNAINFLKEDGIFISSGIIKDRRDEVLCRLKEDGFKVLDVLEIGEWCAIAAKGN